MLDRLIDVVLQFGSDVLPGIIFRYYEEAVLLRFGKFKKVLKPGFHPKIPFADEVIDQHVVITTLSLPAQSLYTKYKQNIVVKGVIKYKISDV